MELQELYDKANEKLLEIKDKQHVSLGHYDPIAKLFMRHNLIEELATLTGSETTYTVDRVAVMELIENGGFPIKPEGASGNVHIDIKDSSFENFQSSGNNSSNSNLVTNPTVKPTRSIKKTLIILLVSVAATIIAGIILYKLGYV